MKALYLTVMLLLCFSPGCQQTKKEEIHSHLSMMYATAWSFPEVLPQFIKEHADILERKDFSREMFRIIDAFQSRALSMPSTENVYNQAVRISSESGRPDMAAQLHDNMMSEKTDLYSISLHFEDLSRSMDGILIGDENIYRNSEIYSYSSLLWNMMAYNTSETFTRTYQQMLFELNFWYIQQLLASL